MGHAILRRGRDRRGADAVGLLRADVSAAGGTLVAAHVAGLGQTVSGGLLSAWTDAAGGVVTISAAGAARPTVDSNGRVTFTTSQSLQYATAIAAITNGCLFAYAGTLPTTGVRSVLGLGANASGSLLQLYRADVTNMRAGGGGALSNADVAAVAGDTVIFCRRHVRAADSVVAIRLASGVEVPAVSLSVGSTFTPDRYTINAQLDLSAGGDCSNMKGAVLVAGAADSPNAPRIYAAMLRFFNRVCGSLMTVTPQVVAFGNSFPAGFGVSAGQGFIENLMARGRFSGWSTSNRAVSGQTTTQMAGNSETDAYPRSQPERTRNIAIVSEIINELQTNGANATNAYNAIRDYCTNLKTAGFEVYCLTPTNRTDGSVVAGFDTARLAVRTSMLANFPALGIPVVDLSSDSRIGGSTAPNDPTYFQADKIHPNATGHGLIADMLAAAIP